MLLTVLALTGCSSLTPVMITNQSATGICNIVVTGTGFSNHIESIAAGAEQLLAIRLRGESGLQATFDATGQE